ncbi:hypothetical protein ABEF95_009647 [Exophiala dermatitidis]
MSNTETSVSSPAPVKPRSKPPSLLACIPCRKSHLKCDGQKPLCSRCADRKGHCFWVESRRGYREFRKSHNAAEDKAEQRANSGETAQRQRSISTPAENGPQFLEDAALTQAGALAYQELCTVDPALTAEPLGYETHVMSLEQIQKSSPSNHSTSTTSIPRDHDLAMVGKAEEAEGTDLIELFYKHFYPAHPFIIPRKMFLQDPSCMPHALRAVIRYLASHYLPQANRSALSNAARVIFSDEIPDDGYKVQGLILSAFVNYARFDQEGGSAALNKAIETAIRLGMQHATFAIQHGKGNPVLEESWRRTWWTLMTIEGVVAVIGGHLPFRTYSTPADVPLPGHDEDYYELRPSPLLRTFADLRNRAVAEDTFEYSTLAYTVEATYILGSVLALGADTFAVTDPQVEAIDASISNFFLSLPPSKREVIRYDGTVDEALVVTHLIINWAAISLHRPRSTLTFIRNHYRTTCTKAEAAGLPALTYASHTAKALRSANNLTDLASVQRPLSYATPWLVCALTASATVLLPAYAVVDRSDQALAIKERLHLILSALGSFGHIWPRAIVARSQVAKFAREVLTAPTTCFDSTPPTALAPLESDGTAQLEYTQSFNNDSWIEQLLRAEPGMEDPLSSLSCGSMGSLSATPAQAQGA